MQFLPTMSLRFPKPVVWALFADSKHRRALSIALAARMNIPPCCTTFSPLGPMYSTLSTLVPAEFVFRRYTKQLGRSSQLPVSSASRIAVTAVLPLALIAQPMRSQNPQLAQAGRP